MTSVLVVRPPARPGNGHCSSRLGDTGPPAGRLGEVIVDAHGTAYTSNPSQNRVEVLTIATGVLGVPIPVGSGPRALDLSADGATLYVVNSESSDVSVVDLVEAGGPPHHPARRPPDVDRGGGQRHALVTRMSSGALRLRLLQIDLASGTVRERTDWLNWGYGPNPSIVSASRDRSRIGVGLGTYESGSVAFYDAGTDTFTAQKSFGPVAYLALDATGATMLAGTDETSVIEGDLHLRATMPTPGTVRRLSGSGAIGYRLKDATVEVLDVERAVVTAAIALPDPAVGWAPALALTPDEGTLVVSTNRGFSVVPTASAVPVPCVRPAAPAGVVAVCGSPSSTW